MVKSVTQNTAAPAQDGGDHVESLESIAALGTELEPVAGGSDQDKKAAQDDAAAALEISAALELLRDAAIPFAPLHTHAPLGIVWSDTQMLKIAKSIVSLCTLYGITVDEFFDKWGPYIKLAAALGMPALATIKILKMPAPAPASDGQQQQA